MKIKLLPIVIMLLALSCQQKELGRINFLNITTHPVQNVTLTSATLSGEIMGIKVGAVEQHGFVWSTSNENPTFVINDGQLLFGAKESDGVFSAELIDLDKNQTYFVRSFMLDGQGEEYGETISFLTSDIQISTDSIQYTQARTATVFGTFKGMNSNLEINRLGIVWSKTNQEPRISGAVPDEYVELDAPQTDGSFFGTIHSLEDSTRYYYRTVVVLNFGNEIAYGETQTLDTNLKDVWKEKSGMPQNNEGAKGFAIGSFGYVLLNNVIFKYDPIANDWEIMSNSGELPLWESATFSIGTNIYTVCGTNNTDTHSKKFYKYDTVNDVWDTSLPDFPGAGRKWTIGFGIGDAGYVGVGQGVGGEPLRDLWKYDEVNGWDSLPDTNPDFPGTTHRVLMGAHSDNERGYIAGDQNAGYFWRYTPETNTWEHMGLLPGGKSNSMASFHINNRLYLGTGATQGQGNTKVFWRYDHEDNSWEELAPLAGLPRSAAVAFAIGNKAYLGGGFIPEIPGMSNTTDEFWEYKAPPD